MPASGAPAVGAIALVRDDTGRVVLVWQTSGPFAGSWLLPGGQVESGEGVGQAAARELREETGLTATDGRLLLTYRTSSDPPGAYDLTVFLYELAAGGELAAEGGSRVGWFEPGALEDPHPTLRRALADAHIRTDDDAAIAAALAAAGIRMERLG